MPVPFSLGQHAALEAVQRHLQDNEKMFAYLDEEFLDRIPLLSDLQCVLLHCASARATHVIWAVRPNAVSVSLSCMMRCLCRLLDIPRGLGATADWAAAPPGAAKQLFGSVGLTQCI